MLTGEWKRPVLLVHLRTIDRFFGDLRGAGGVKNIARKM